MTDETPGKLSYGFAKANGLVALGGDPAPDDGHVQGAPIRLGTRGTPAPGALIEARRALARPIRLEPVSESRFEQLLGDLYAVDAVDSERLGDDLNDAESLESGLDGLPETADLLDSDDDAPIIRLINGMIAEAVKRRGSDIHVEPFESALTIRVRIDGVLQEVLSLPARLAPLLVSRIKVMARLDIAEKRLPQDGRISLTLGGHAIDVRVSTLPSRHGERVVLRLLDRDKALFTVAELGMDPATERRFKAALRQPNGVILVTGPTGSGKTTTLYAGLSLLNEESRNILTVEDPVEYALEGVGQTQVNPKVGMTFAAGLRAMLRQDPDVVMVGEIRDVETAEIAVQASLTGHLVLSTVHTNSAVAAVTRLRDMGVEPFLIASAVKAILAQRLVRRLCPHCKAPVQADAAMLARLGRPADEARTLYRARGCGHCNQTGYQGRVGLYELVLVDDTISRLIHDDARESALQDAAFANAPTLEASGIDQVLAGETTLEEVLRVIHQGDSLNTDG
ncbi:type II secretion system ATPase GspE [Yunchengibacter salinarum]|uniref:type II secretion system ATPase GspE n=1 Tax=Yunchengibacter salinarum TaxID=3133399 RepID=UPI0035B60397